MKRIAERAITYYSRLSAWCLSILCYSLGHWARVYKEIITSLQSARGECISSDHHAHDVILWRHCSLVIRRWRHGHWPV